MIRRISPAHATQLQAKWATFLDDPQRSMFYAMSSAIEHTLRISESDWNRVQRISLVGDEVVGYMSADVDRDTNAVTSLSAVNFCPGSMVYPRDVMGFVDSLRRQFLVVRWGCAEGSPNEALYRKAIKHVDGEVVGRARHYFRLQTGETVGAVFFESPGYKPTT